MLLAAAPAVAEGSGDAAAAPQTGLFVLVAVLCLFAYVMFNAYTLGSRLQRLEERLRDERPDPLARFSWSVLDGTYEPLPFLGESLAVSRPGLYLVGARDPAMVPTLAANIVHQLLAREDLAVIMVSLRLTQDALGEMLLSLEAGVAWGSLERAEQDRLLHRLEGSLRRYEEDLWLLRGVEWSPDGLLQQIARLQKAEERTAAILIDDLRALQDDAGEALLDRLRLVSQRAAVPIFLLAPSQESGAFMRWRTVAAERFEAILEFDRPADGSEKLEIQFIRYPETPPQAGFELNPTTGQIVQA